MTGFKKLNVVPEDMARDLQTMVREWRVTNGFRRSSSAKPADRPIVFEDTLSITVMLLESLNASRVAWAERLKIDVDAYITDVVVLGWPQAAVETVQVKVGTAPSVRAGGNYVTYDIPLNATAEEFKQITGVTGEVSLGARKVQKDDGTQVLLVPSRWRIKWDSKNNAEPIKPGLEGQHYIVRAEETQLHGTGQLVKVIQTLPTGWDTPLRAGAICETVKGRGVYHKVIGAEARFWYGTDISSGAT